MAEIPKRYLDKITLNQTTGCWLWNGATMPNGYGLITVSTKKRFTAHRVFFCISRDLPFDIGGDVRHSCDVRNCCNPDHLSLGSHADNLADMRSKNRSTKGRPSECRGSKHVLAKLTEEQAREIKRAPSVSKAAELSVSFGCSKGLGHRIYYGDIWKWLKV